MGHTWGTLGAEAVGAQLRQKSDLKHSFCKLNTLGAQSYLGHTWGFGKGSISVEYYAKIAVFFGVLDGLTCECFIEL